MSEDIEQLVNCLQELQTAKYDTHTDILASCAQADHNKNSSNTMSEDIEQLVNCLQELQTAKYDTHTDILASCAQADHNKNSSNTMSEDIEQLVNCLQELQTAKYDTHTDILASCAQADRVLDLIYDLGTEKTEISNEKKAIIGPLLENSLKSIEIGIKRIATEYRRKSEILRKRSALQFLIDGFGDYPTKTPEKKFSEFFDDIKEIIEILDDIISEWKEHQDPEDSDSDIDYADELLASLT